MQNEILKPVLDTDEVAVPRYDIVSPSGAVVQQNVELRLKNEVVQEGTPYDEESVLPASLREQLALPQSATPAEAMSAIIKAGGAALRNRAPLTTDSARVGTIWMVPEMFFHNLMPNALAHNASDWNVPAGTASVSGKVTTFAGNGSAAELKAEVTMNNSVKVGDLVFSQLSVVVNHDANNVIASVSVDDFVLATNSLSVPAAGATMQILAVTPAEVAGTPKLTLTATYNTSAVQSGKGFTVQDITVWNLTDDMCEAVDGNEFTQAEAAQYISTYGMFQTREYEFSMWWWILRGNTGNDFVWTRLLDPATQAEAQAGTDNTKLMTALRVKNFYDAWQASTTQAQAGTDNTKWMSPALVKAWWDALYASLVLPIARGGTGLQSSPSMLVNLASTAADTVLEASPRPGVTGTLPVGNGGTGKTSWTANRLMYPSAAATLSQLAFPSVAGSVLAQAASGAPYWRSDIITLLDLLKGLGAEGGVATSVTWTLTSGKTGGAAWSSGNCSMKALDDYAEYTASITGASATMFLIYMAALKFVRDGSSAAPTDKCTLYIGSTAYQLGNNSGSGYSQRSPAIDFVGKVGKVPATSTIKLRFTCITDPSSSTISYGSTVTDVIQTYTKGGMS